MHRVVRIAVLPVLALAALGLAGCGERKSVEAENESARSVAGKVAAAGIHPRPGRWESVMKMERMEIANMPPQAREAMNRQMGASQTFTSCLTKEEAEKPGASFFQKDASDCTYDRFSMADGRIDAVMTCGQGPQARRTAMTGVYGEESYEIRISSEGEAQPGMPMSMAMSIASRRVGDCNGKEEL